MSKTIVNITIEVRHNTPEAKNWAKKKDYIESEIQDILGDLTFGFDLEERNGETGVTRNASVWKVNINKAQ